MTARQPRYSKEKFAHRGQALYEKCVRPRVERGNRGRIVAIDIETGEFEVGDDAVAASGAPSHSPSPKCPQNHSLDNSPRRRRYQR